MVWQAALAAALMASTGPPQKFDLVCAGTAEKLAIGGAVSTPYQRHLRIDLATGQWCAEDCAKVERIARVEPGRLLLRDVKIDTPREYWVERESVDRVTGEHSSMATDSPAGPSPRSAFSKGHCELAPFSEFAKAVRF